MMMIVMEAPTQPVPVLTDWNREFWTGGARGELRITRCNDCSRWVHPPAPVCNACYSRDVAPQAASGLGTVHTFSVNHHAWTPAFPPPYVIALVELDEQPALRLLTHVVGCDPEDVHIGMRVQARFHPLGDGMHRPEFAPVQP
jgi:uncharacterized protein